MVRPLYAIVENVAALLSRGMGTVLGDLAEIGYDAEWHCIPASAVGAEHERDRIWIIAHPDEVRELQPERGQQKQRRRAGDGAQADAPDLDETRREGRVQTGENGKNVGIFSERLRLAINSSPTPSREHWNHKPVLGRGIHGVSNRMDRIGGLGNSVFPAIPEMIGRAIMQIERDL
jgi:DNA (cytosine-5)-methyltransferase 1